MWQHIDSLPAPGKVGEIRWRNWHGKLKVRRNANAPSPCPDGDGTATSYHIVNACTTAEELRTWMAAKGVRISKTQWARDWIPETGTPKEGEEAALDIAMTCAKTATWRRYAAHAHGQQALRSREHLRADTTAAIALAKDIAVRRKAPAETVTALLSIISTLTDTPLPKTN